MEFKVFNHGRSCHADGIYSDGKVTVLKGSKLFIDCNNKFNRYAEAFALRNNAEVVDAEGILLRFLLLVPVEVVTRFGKSKMGYH